jgi:signal transduction histidine kinase
MGRNDQIRGAATLLVVDDAPFFRRLLLDLLQSRGFTVLEAACGQEVIDLINRQEIDALLSDIEMPGMNGPELLRRVKRQQPDVPVIMISSHHDFQAAREVLRDGALEYLTKPIVEAELYAAIDRALDLRQQTRKRQATEHQAQRRLSDLVLLRDLGDTANSSDNLQRLVDKVLDSIWGAVEVEIASLMLLEQDGLLHIRAARGLPAEVIQTTRIAPGQGVAGYVLAQGEPVLIDDLERDGRFLPAQGAHRYKTSSLLSVPLRSRDRVIGVINVNNKTSGETFTAVDQALLTTIANQTALAIENFELVSSLRQKARELEQANQSLQQQQQARSRLVCNLSHELKTPLTSVLGYVDLALNFFEQMEPEALRDYLQQVHAQGSHMARLVEGMLTLFTLDAGGGSWQPEELSLPQVLGQCLTERQADCEAAALRLELSNNPQPAVYADRELLGALLAALLDNAIKFNRPQGRLELRSQLQNHGGLDYVYLQIHNDGTGIPPEAQRSIFEQYVQLGEINTAKPEGVGIGLALSQAILQRLHGQIFLEPAGDEGATFGLLLPTRASYGVLIDGQAD